MAQLDRPQRRDSPATTFDMLRDGESLRNLNISPRRQDGAEEHHSLESPRKKSVMTKVKEKAKKFKHSLSFKKKHHDHDDATLSPFGEDEHEVGNPEYLAAPKCESPKRCKEAASNNNPKLSPVICEKHVLPDTAPFEEQNVTVESPNTKPLTEAETTQNALAPVAESLSEETRPEASSVENQTSNNVANASPKKLESKIWDKGVAVKDYLLNKFEPAEEDRALSRAISEAMVNPRSPKKASGDGDGSSEASVADMVREAVTSLLRNQNPHSPRSTSSVETHSMMLRQIPVSSDAHEVEEENHGRVLQTN